MTVTPVFLLKMDGNSGSTFHRRKVNALEEFYTTVEATLCQRNQKPAIFQNLCSRNDSTGKSGSAR
jgi:hypothetical protein